MGLERLCLGFRRPVRGYHNNGVADNDDVGAADAGKTTFYRDQDGDTYTTTRTGERVLSRTTYQWRLRVPGYTLWNLGLRYRYQPSKSSYDHTFALNVNNALNKQFLRAGTSGATRILQGDDRAIFITYTINHKGAKF